MFLMEESTSDHMKKDNNKKSIIIMIYNQWIRTQLKVSDLVINAHFAYTVTMGTDAVAAFTIIITICEMNVMHRNT